KNKLKSRVYQIKQAQNYNLLTYEINRIKYELELINRKNILNENHEKKQSTSIPVSTKSETLLSLYEQLYELVNSNSFESNKYLALKHKLSSFKAMDEKKETSLPIDPNELLIIITYLVSYLYKRPITKLPEKFTFIFELYEIGLQLDLFRENGIISEQKFSNVLNVAFEVDEFQWAQSFIHKYSSSLPEKTRSTILILANARLAFEMQNFKKVLTLLEKIRPNNVAHSLELRLLKIRSLYEMRDQSNKYFEETEAVFNAFQVYLTKEKATLNHSTIENCRNFLIIFRHLFDRKRSLEDIQQKFNSKQNIVCHSWLQKKIKDYTPFF
ncbi:MAG: hypothetical protein MRY78_02550, partial [Saprospiraceae bacterium]|nr:hypothetical protein [Saprospiraceae bacterium]